jgi:pre-rRNA-processing protein TSR3
MIDFNQCDNKRCTGRKMERFDLVKTLKGKEKQRKYKGIVLSAFGVKIISI